MPKLTFHFLNVKDGDCSIIEHGSGHVSVIDVCNARKVAVQESLTESLYLQARAGQGNYQQKKYPVNPIEYLKKHNISSVFRFMLTHPDMDHMDGIKDFFEEFRPANFCDTDNTEEKDFSSNNRRYREEDWLFYRHLREQKPENNPRRLTLFSGDDGIHRTKNWEGQPPGDAFYTLAPSPDLVRLANETKDFNDASYVVLYHAFGGKILLCGDGHDDTWEHVLKAHSDSIKDIDLMIAPHHGRDSSRSYDFLDVTKPKMTFFGNARSEHLAYDAWNRRGLKYITNNQAGSMIVETGTKPMKVYVTNESYARDMNQYTYYKQELYAWYLTTIN